MVEASRVALTRKWIARHAVNREVGCNPTLPRIVAVMRHEDGTTRPCNLDTVAGAWLGIECRVKLRLQIGP